MAVKNFVYILFVTTLVVTIYQVKSLLPPSQIIEVSDAPFMVYLRNRHHYCGGVILSPDIVLTASHCIYPKHMRVLAGRSAKYVANDNMQSVGVKKTLPHEDYLLDPNGIQAYNDVGLLLLDTPLTFNQYVQPIKWTDKVDLEKPATIYGWGSIDAFENSPSDHLRSKNITLITDNLCIELLNKAVTKCTKQVYEICAEKSACNGDSGSPLVQTVDNVTMLIGITSWLADDNISCDTAPTVFENVGHFSDWIKDGMKILLEENGKNVTENPVDFQNMVNRIG